jgi:hypothetical protein
MSFPLSITQKFYIPEDFVKSRKLNTDSALNLVFNELLHREVENLEQKPFGIHYHSEESLFRIPFEIKISFSKDELGIFSFFESRLERFIRIIIAVTVLSSFLSILSIGLFLTFAGLFIFLFYAANVIVIQNNNEKFAAQIFGISNFDFENSEKLTRLQKEWMKDVFRCPACGAYVSEIDLNCPDCGLKVKQNRNSIPLNITKFKDRIVKYNYHENK